MVTRSALIGLFAAPALVIGGCASHSQQQKSSKDLSVQYTPEKPVTGFVEHDPSLVTPEQRADLREHFDNAMNFLKGQTKPRPDDQQLVRELSDLDLDELVNPEKKPSGP